MDSKEEILNFLRQNHRYLHDNFHITKIGLFGSFAKDKQNDDSDIDLLIDIEQGTKDIYDLKISLKRYLSDKLGRDVDIAREKYLKPYAKKYILQDVIYV